MVFSVHVPEEPLRDHIKYTPQAIAEAHNQAVVKGGDKARFFALLEQQMIKAGLRNVGTSYKEARKRGSIA